MRRVRFLLACLALSSICSIAAAQYTPTQPDNALTPGDPVGVPPQPSTAGTHEAVSDTNGALSFFLPVLSLPQRGGWNLTLGYVNTSPSWQMRQDSKTQIIVQQGGAPTLTNINYTANIQLYAAGGPLYLNLPTIEASIEYAGQITTATNIGGSPAAIAPVVCVTNWIFTDWSGNRHPFSNVTECSAISEPLAQVTDSSDGSWLRMDTTNYHSDITVRTKDGTTYHFPGWLASGDPFSGCNQQSSCYGGGAWAPTSANFYSTAFSSMVDSTGQNTVTYNSSAGTLTDTIGRTISLTNGITYKDANGNSQTITIAATQQPTQTYNFTVTCSQGKFIPALTVGEAYGPMSFPEHPLTYTVTLPAVNGVSRVYTLQFDGLGNLLQVNYPSGGYTKYDYQDFYFYNVANVETCSRTEHQVAHRRECPLSSGACSSSQELVTTYTANPDASLPFNDSMSVQDPLGTVTYVQNQNLSTYPFTVPHEATRKIYPPGSQTPVRTIQTAYTSSNACGNVDVYVPSSATTTLNDISPALSAVTNYQYQTVIMKYYYFSSCAGPAQVFINNAIEIDENDYGASSPTKKTAQTWMTTSNGSLYDIAGGHLLDRLATRTIIDPVTNVQSTLSYGYNSVGEITSKTAGGTGLTSLITNYQRDAYGNITQVTDPKGNITKYGYSDTWAQTTCAPGLNSSAYLTSITDALTHVTNFAYNSCTGSKASATDPNGAKTSMAYDALGRATSAVYPDGGQTTTTHLDSAPNSVTVSKLINSSTNLQRKAILDGFSRNIQTQLLSDPDGVTFTDTTYDALGRTAAVSNPYRTSNDPGPTNGTTSYFYDALDRTCLVVPPDGTLPPGGVCPTTQPSNTIFTTYSGNTTTVTDQAGKSRKSATDALGRMTQVTEDPSGLAYVTNYGYDVFANLKSVVQNGSHQRNFVYDALSRLTSATNPESGTITYVYDADSNVVTKTSPAPNQTGSATVSTGYSYDALNRLTGKTYSDGTLPVAYFFDGQTPPATNSSGSGTVTINGSEQTSPGTQATGTISVSGVTLTSQTITVGTVTCRLGLATGMPAQNAASAIAQNCNWGIVTAKALSNNVNLTSVVGGTAGDYSLSWTGFSGSLSGMSGGANGTPDSGTVSVTVNGFQQSVSYGSGSSGTTVASALVTAFNGNSSSPVTASATNNVLTLTAKATGSASNYSLSASDTYNTSLFSGPSFAPVSGFSLTGGCNADSITVTNGIYRRTGMCDAAGAEAWSYDSMGRILADQRTTNGLSNIFSYTYNLDGSPLTEVHPILALTINFVQGGAGRLTSETSNDASYAANVHYAPNGALCYMNSSWGNAFTHIWTFNNRLQPARIQLYGTGHGASNPLCSASSDAASNLDLGYSFVDANGHNNGNVVSVINNLDGDRTQSFSYDSLNRLSSAWTAGTNQPTWSGDTDYLSECWAENYSYDPWGNLLSIAPSSSSSYTGCTQESGFNFTNFISAKNQITESGFSYDSAGNMIAAPSATYAYNAENQLVSAAGVTYGYDGDGKRVTKAPSSAPTQPNYIYWYGRDSSPVIETDGAGHFQYRYISFNGMRVSREEANDWVDHYGLDALGNVRFVYGLNGTSDNSDYYPFGGERVLNSGTNNHYKFTSKERDTESNIDDFGARYMSSAIGRFTSADWSDYPDPVPHAELADPQSLNLYNYTENNPLNMVDEDGHDDIPVAAATCGFLCRLVNAIFGGGGGSATHEPSTTGPSVQFPRPTLQRRPPPSAAVTIPFPLLSSGSGTAAATVAGTAAAGAGVVAGAYWLIHGVTDTLVQNSRDQENLAAIESLVGAENARMLFSQNQHTVTVIQGLIAAAQTELGKMSGPEGDPHHKNEIRAMLERAKRLAERLPGKSREMLLNAIKTLEGRIPGGPL